jgi:hypothetical protein
MPHADPKRLRMVRILPQLVAYLQDGLRWPIESEAVEK